MKLLNEINYLKLKKDFTEKFPETDVINVYNLDIDPFVGTGQNTELSISDMIKTDSNELDTAITNGVAGAGLSSMMKLLGVDKMLDMTELSKQLQNISKTELDDAATNIL